MHNPYNIDINDKDFFAKLGPAVSPPHPNAIAFGQILKRHRRARFLPQTELARRSGITQATIARIETGRANPTIRTMSALARVLEVELLIDLKQL